MCVAVVNVNYLCLDFANSVEAFLTDTLVSCGQLQLRTFFSFPKGVRLRELPLYNYRNKITDRFSPNLSLRNMMESLVIP